jgi:P-type Cu+ transporter
VSETVVIPVVGMTCTSCVSRITRRVRRVPGIRRLRVDLVAETLTVELDPSMDSLDGLASAVREVGYDLEMGAAAAGPPLGAGLLARLRARRQRRRATRETRR